METKQNSKFLRKTILIKDPKFEFDAPKFFDLNVKEVKIEYYLKFFN